MEIQMLISSVDQKTAEMAETMNLETEALIINQCDQFSYEEYLHKGKRIRCYSLAERGVGLSRNTALMRADKELCLFGDEDIVYDSGYGKAVEEAFAQHPEADLLLFNPGGSCQKDLLEYKRKTDPLVQLWKVSCLQYCSKNRRTA